MPDAGDVEVLGLRWAADERGSPAAARHPAAGDPAVRQADGDRDPDAVPQLLPAGGGSVGYAGARAAAGKARRAGRRAVGRAEAAARPGMRAGRRSGSPVPRRADDRSRSAGASPALGPDRASSSRPGRTILLTTHYMEEAEQLCDRVAIMDHGTVIARGTPRELIASHRRRARRGVLRPAPPPTASTSRRFGRLAWRARCPEPTTAESGCRRPSCIASVPALLAELSRQALPLTELRTHRRPSRTSSSRSRDGTCAMSSDVFPSTARRRLRAPPGSSGTRSCSSRWCASASSCASPKRCSGRFSFRFC